MAIIRIQKVTITNMLHRILAIVTILLVCAMATEAETPDKPHTETSLPSDGVSLVIVKNTNGNIKVLSWERPEVLVKVFMDNGEYSDEAVTEVERIEDRIEIASKLPGGIRSNIRMDYDIYTPEDVELDIETVNGSIYVSGSRSKGKMTTVNGNIELKNMAGSVSAKTNNGNIYAEIFFDASSSFVTLSGSIDVRIGDEFSVPVSARTVSGSISFTIPEGFSADLDAATQSGRVSCEIPISGAVEGRSLRGRIFGGGPLLKLRAISGNITIKASEDINEYMEETFQRRAEEEEQPEIQEIPVVETVRTLTPPIIDGRLDDKCWKNAGRIENFVWANGIENPHEPTEAYLLWDEQNLYIGIKCYESRMDAITISNTEPDSDVWDDDMVQFLIDPTPVTGMDYYHISVNSIGVVIDRMIDAEHVKRRSGESTDNTKWNSGGLLDTDMQENFWSIEAGIPFSALGVEPEEGDIWRLNIHRTEQRRKEYTYWSPTYGPAEWPHVPDRFGELVFTAGQLITPMPPEQPIPSEEALAISHITIQGNDTVSQEEILEALGLKTGDLVDVDALSQAKTRLHALGWFKNVGMELTENDKGVDLVVKVVEKEIFSLSEVQVRGSNLFEERQIIDYFNLGSARTTRDDVNVKCKLISGLYKAKGYEMPTVNYSVISNALIIDIDEGNIDKIEIRGNRKVRTRDITKSLDLKPGMPYKKSTIENAIHTLKARLPYFSSIDWESEKSDDGLNVLYINVKEADLIKTGLDGITKFDRVHGFQWGLKTEVKSIYGIYGGSRAHIMFSYGFSSKIWDYQFGVEKSFFRKHRSTIGIDVHRITDTNDRELVSDTEHFIAEAILGEAWRDFYQREGFELNFGQKLTSSTEFGLRYRDDEYMSLDKNTDWSILDRSYADDDWYDRWAGSRSRDIFRTDRDEKYKPNNPRIVEGTMKSLIAEYTIDTRNSKKDPANGWLNTFYAEYAGGSLGGDFDFALYKVNIRRYNRLSGNQFLTFRIKAATTNRELSTLHPRKFYLGGIGTLRGYPFKEFSGDRMALINVEYWVTTGWPLGLGIVFFVDSGYAWPYESDAEIDDMKTDVGVGFQLGGLRVNLASPIREKEKETVLSFRLARMF